MLTYADRKEINKKQTRRRQSGEMKAGSEAGGWNLAHLLPWQGSQSCVMLWRLRDGQGAAV